tara:strand:+ start:1474 stop:1848 length:375 start_codon:yes stop_codon:yes gene_type:complete
MTGNYNLYFSITKEDYKKAIPSDLQGKYSRVVDGNIEVASSWEVAVEWGMFPWVRKSLNWDTSGVSNSSKYAIIKDEWSALNGELSALIGMGSGMNYPKNSVLTKAEAKNLSKSDLFTEDSIGN